MKCSQIQLDPAEAEEEEKEEEAEERAASLSLIMCWRVMRIATTIPSLSGW